MTGEIEQVIEGHSDWVYCVAFSPDGTCMVSGSLNDSVLIWNITPSEKSGHPKLPPDVSQFLQASATLCPQTPRPDHSNTMLISISKVSARFYYVILKLLHFPPWLHMKMG